MSRIWSLESLLSAQICAFSVCSHLRIRSCCCTDDRSLFDWICSHQSTVAIELNLNQWFDFISTINYGCRLASKFTASSAWTSSFIPTVVVGAALQIATASRHHYRYQVLYRPPIVRAWVLHNLQSLSYPSTRQVILRSIVLDPSCGYWKRYHLSTQSLGTL